MDDIIQAVLQEFESRADRETERMERMDSADLWKLYIPCFNLFYPKLNPGALIVADNMILPEFSRPDAMAYQQHVRSKPEFESILLPVGSGIELSRKIG